MMTRLKFLYTLLLSAFFVPYVCILVKTIYTEPKIPQYLLDQEIGLLLKNTFIHCAGSALLSLCIGFIMAYILFRVERYGRNFYMYATIIAIGIPSHIQISAWLGVCGRSGVFTPYLLYIFPDFSLYNLYGCVWISGWSYAPLATLCCGVILHNVDRNIEMKASTYLSPLQSLFYVLLPMAKKNLLLLFTSLFFLNFADVRVTDVLRIQDTLTQKIYLLFNIYYKPELALILSIPSFSLVILFVFSFRYFSPVIFYSKSDKFLYQVGKWKIAFFSIATIIFCGYWLAIPILAYITQSFEKWWTVFYAIRAEMWHSVYVCSLSTFAIVAVALPIAWSIAREKPSNYVVLVLLWLAFVPDPIAGIVTVRTLNFLSSLAIVGNLFYTFQDTSFILVWSFTAKFLPFAVMLLFFAISQMTERWEALSQTDGYSRQQTFFRVVMPICYEQILLCSAVTFVLCMGETIISVLVIAPGTTTLSVRILTLLHNGARADLSAASLWFLVVIFCVIAIILVNIVIRRTIRKPVYV